jgi:ABC-type transport system involved in cytochrome bd biosynthesis fused ATPase/permease subunit
MYKFSNYYIGRVLIEFIKIFNILIVLSKKKKYFILYFIFSLVIIILESYSLSIVFNATNSIMNDNFKIDNFFLNFFLKFINISIIQLGIYSIIALFIFIFIKNILILFFIFFKNNLLTNIQKTITNSVLKNFLNQNYTFFINKNSSEMISSVQQDVGLLMRNYVAVLSLLVEFVLIFFLLTNLIFINFKVGFFFLGSISLYFLFYTLFTKKKILELSNERSILNQKVIKSLQETFANFREFIIYDCKKFFFDQLHLIFDKFFSNLKLSNILQQSSKLLIEQIFIIAIICTLLFGKSIGDKNYLQSIVPLLAVYLFTFLKILPSLNTIIIETQSYMYTKLFVNKINEKIFSQVSSNIEKNYPKLKFENKIQLKNISYKFQDKYVFKNLNLEIKKSEKIGIIGLSGAGKTTLLNIIMGFLNSSSGEIMIDDVKIDNKNVNKWQNNFAYVSQSVYLIDDSIIRNITLENDNNKIDKELFKDSIIKSGLDNFLKNNEERINDSIGERGSKISGGELLRVGLARAYYSQRDIFILDEFTSALDETTEVDILNKLNKINKTLIIVSHKKSTLKYCDRIFQIKNFSLEQI